MVCLLDVTRIVKRNTNRQNVYFLDEDCLFQGNPETASDPDDACWVTVDQTTVPNVIGDSHPASARMFHTMITILKRIVWAYFQTFSSLAVPLHQAARRKAAP